MAEFVFNVQPVRTAINDATKYATMVHVQQLTVINLQTHLVSPRFGAGCAFPAKPLMSCSALSLVFTIILARQPCYSCKTLTGVFAPEAARRRSLTGRCAFGRRFALPLPGIATQQAAGLGLPDRSRELVEATNEDATVVFEASEFVHASNGAPRRAVCDRPELIDRQPATVLRELDWLRLKTHRQAPLV
jgi:hypothetical protein